MVTKAASVQSTNFNLKREAVELVAQAPRSRTAHVAISELEAMRVGRPSITASKHGLEAICGASCDTAAQ
jgi:hypothetical protein